MEQDRKTQYDFKMYRGDARKLEFEILDKNDVAVPLDPVATVGTMTVRYAYDGSALFTKVTSNPAQGSISNPEKGKITFLVVAADTKALQKNTRVIYDVELMLGIEGPYTVALGNILIELDVTTHP